MTGINSVIAAAVVSLGLSAVGAHAVTYTEPPDLSNSDIGTLDFGLNTVSGTLSIECTALAVPLTFCGTFSGDKIDAFNFLVPGGGILTAATLTISNYTDNTGIGYSDWGSFSGLSTDTARGNFSNTDILGASSGTGSQNLFIGAVIPASVNAQVGDKLSFSWQTSFTVSRLPSVPLPAGLPLILTGLAGLAGLAVRKRKGAGVAEREQRRAA